MKRKTFLIFTALIIISVSICLLIDFQKAAMLGLIVGYACSTVITVYLVVEDNNPPIGRLIGIGLMIGLILALLAGGIFQSINGSIFAFIGSILGAVVGCMYKDDSDKKIEVSEIN